MTVSYYQDPFRHWVQEDFFPQSLIQDAYDAVPPKDWDGWVRYNSSWEKKRTCNKLSILPYSLRKIFESLNSSLYVQAMGDRLGIEGLIADPYLHGAGVHVSDPGDFLQVHGDYEIHPKLPDHERRLNLILFLNPEWRSYWGGQLLLCDGMGKTQRSYSPGYNRAVIFETGNASFHGVRETSRDSLPRVTIACYYLSPRRPSAHRMRAMFIPNRSGEGVPEEVKLLAFP